MVRITDINFRGVMLECEFDFQRGEAPVYDVESPVCGPGCPPSAEIMYVRHEGEDITDLLHNDTLNDIEDRIVEELEEYA